MDEIRTKARNLLETHTQHNSIPINVEGIAGALNIGVESTVLPEEISGVLDTSNPQEPVILLNTNQKLKRKRFSLAHELGHYVLHHREGKVHVDKTVFFRNDIPNKEDRRMEREANVFASELLMPENLVRKSFSSICSGEILYSQWDQDELPSEMAEQFQVSLSAMVIRLRELRLIPNGF